MDIIYKVKEATNDSLKAESDFIKIGITPILAKIFSLKNINSYDELNEKTPIETWKNLSNIESAAEIIIKAIVEKKKICIVADYDADGATSCAIAVRGIRFLGGVVDFFVPNRFVHGYGLSKSVVQEVKELLDPSLIITVDNGITSVEGVEVANSLGIGVLVTDHHLQADVLPNALCIVNPNQRRCNFKNKALAGCGVIFYVLMATQKIMLERGIIAYSQDKDIMSLLDLVAIGTVADVVKLNLDNRILVRGGLNLIRGNKTKQGIVALINVINKNQKKLTSKEIAFLLAPRINAAGRLEDMSLGIKLLLSDDYNESFEMAKELDIINKTRKSIEKEMSDDILNVDALYDTKFGKVAYKESFHEGVVGIVASRIKDRFYMPAIVFADALEDGLVKGSGRSIPEVHLKDLLDSVYCKNIGLIEKFGGHSAAAGLTIKKENLEKFAYAFDAEIKTMVGDRELINLKEIDLVLSEDQITLDLAGLIGNEIWGQGFGEPLFCSNLNILEQKLLNNTHLKLRLEKSGYLFDAIWFFRDHEIESENVDFVYSLGINEFRGDVKLQLFIENIL